MILKIFDAIGTSVLIVLLVFSILDLVHIKKLTAQGLIGRVIVVLLLFIVILVRG